MPITIKGEVSAPMQETNLPASEGARAERCKYYRDGDPLRQLFFTPSATRQLLRTVQWDQKTAENTLEQGGLLVGRLCRDSSHVPPVRFGMVESIIPVPTADRSATHLNISSDAWVSAYRQMEAQRNDTGVPLVSLGWYHTHPRALTTDFSVLDERMQKQSFATEMSFAVVLNPQRRCWQAYVGAGARCACAVMQLDDELAAGVNFKEERRSLLSQKLIGENDVLPAAPPAGVPYSASGNLWFCYDSVHRQLVPADESFVFRQSTLDWAWKTLSNFTWYKYALLYAMLYPKPPNDVNVGWVGAIPSEQQRNFYYYESEVNALFIRNEAGTAPSTADDTRRLLQLKAEQFHAEFRSVKWLIILEREDNAAPVQLIVIELRKNP